MRNAILIFALGLLAGCAPLTYGWESLSDRAVSPPMNEWADPLPADVTPWIRNETAEPVECRVYRAESEAGSFGLDPGEEAPLPVDACDYAYSEPLRVDVLCGDFGAAWWFDCSAAS